MKLVIDIPDVVYKNAKDGMLDELQSLFICGSVTEGKPLPTLTDSEQRLFLSAISREEKVCKSIDDDKVPDNAVRMLVPLCKSIERKVKEVLF